MWRTHGGGGFTRLAHSLIVDIAARACDTAAVSDSCSSLGV